MRIFCAIEEEPFPGNRLWHNNIIGALRDLGHDVVLLNFPPLDAFYRHADIAKPDHLQWILKNRPLLEAALIDQIKKAHTEKRIDLFLSYFYSAHATVTTILKIRSLGIRTMNWFCNASYQFHLVQELAPGYDVSLVPEKDRLDDYRRIGANPIYCQEAANPRVYENLNLSRDLDIIFIGQRYATREELCHAIQQSGARVDAWGIGWSASTIEPLWKQVGRTVQRIILRLRGERILQPDHCHGFVDDSEIVRLYNRAKIALGFGVVSAPDYRIRPRYQIRLRDFEAPMCGTFYLMEHQDEIREFFRPGEEIETFRSAEELVEKAHFYLKNEAARNRIREAGYARAHRDHTWQKRLTNVFARIA